MVATRTQAAEMELGTQWLPQELSFLTHNS
jgi:hypothetical protein